MSQRPFVGAILCAGFGSRLHPLTDVLPKPLLPFLNTPLVAFALNHLAMAEVERVGLNLHHLPDTIPPIVDRLCTQFGMRPVYAQEWEILGTSGGIRGIWRALGEPDATLVALNGDSVMNIDLKAQLQAHRESGARATIVIRPRNHDQPGRVWLDGDGELAGLRNMRHPDAGPDAKLEEYDFTGVHILEPSLLEEIPLDKGCMVGDVYGPMLERGERIRVVINDDFWAALDTPALFMDTTRRILDDPRLFNQAPLPAPTGEGLYLCATGTVDAKTQFAGPVFTGLHTTLAAGAKIGPYAVMDGVEVTGGSTIRNAIVYGMGAIEGEWMDCIAVAGKVVMLDSEEPEKHEKSE